MDIVPIYKRVIGLDLEPRRKSIHFRIYMLWRAILQH